MNDQGGSRMERWNRREDGHGRAGDAGPDRLPPHSLEDEQGLLGCCMLSPREVVAECVGLFGKAGAEVFYDFRNGEIFLAMCGLQERGDPVTALSVWQELKGNPRSAGWAAEGLGYVSELESQAPSSAAWEYFGPKVRELFLQREMLAALGKAQERIYGWTRSAGLTQELMDSIEAAVLAVNQSSSGHTARGMKELIVETNEVIESIRRGVGIIGGIRTHFGYLDKMTGGLHPGELALLAARPSVGKTSLMMNLGVNIASLERAPVGIFSMEMKDLDLTLRMRCAEAGVSFHKLRTGFAKDEEIARLMEGKRAGRLSQWPIYIDDSPALGILELRARARRLHQRHGVRVFMIDYTQLMHGKTGRDYQSREREVADISSGLKQMALELDVPVLALSQLNREMERAKNRVPMLSDLRDSGALEQDADLVMMLYRPKSEEEEDSEGDEIRVNALIAKQRNGPTGPVEMIFRKSLMQMEDAYQNRGMKLPVQGQPQSEGPGKPRGGELPSNEDLGLGK